MKEKRTFTKIADTMYKIAVIAFFVSIIIGGIGIKFSETVGMIFAYIGVAAFVYMLTVGLVAMLAADTIDNYMEKKEPHKMAIS